MKWNDSSYYFLTQIFYLRTDIEDVCCNRQDMFVFQTGGCLTRYSLIPPKQCAAKLFVMGDWLQCSKVFICVICGIWAYACSWPVSTSSVYLDRRYEPYINLFQSESTRGYNIILYLKSKISNEKARIILYMVYQVISICIYCITRVVRSLFSVIWRYN